MEERELEPRHIQFARECLVEALVQYEDVDSGNLPEARAITEAVSCLLATAQLYTHLRRPDDSMRLDFDVSIDTHVVGACNAY